MNLNINLNRLKNYHKYDPQYNPIYNDSREYAVNIQPITLQEKNNSDDYKLFLKHNYPRISRCWGERYENCQILKGDKNLCSKSFLTTRDPAPYLENDITDEIKPFNDIDNVSSMNTNSKLKKINSNTLYDVTRIPIDNKLNLVVDRTPDTLDNNYKSCNLNVKKNDIDIMNKNIYHDSDIIEGYDNTGMDNYNFKYLIIYLIIIIILVYILYKIKLN
jgi:hypothetical protein